MKQSSPSKTNSPPGKVDTMRGSFTAKKEKRPQEWSITAAAHEWISVSIKAWRDPSLFSSLAGGEENQSMNGQPLPRLLKLSQLVCGSQKKRKEKYGRFWIKKKKMKRCFWRPATHTQEFGVSSVLTERRKSESKNRTKKWTPAEFWCNLCLNNGFLSFSLFPSQCTFFLPFLPLRRNELL